MSRAARLAEFEREDIQAAESLALTFELRDAGSWHAARCTGPGARVCGYCADPIDETPRERAS
jgi:hypothetical protein